MIRILVDSSADYTTEELKEKNIELIPITITIGDKEYRDGVDITSDELYNMLISGSEFPKTAQPSPQDFLDIFEDAKEKGDSVVYISLSSSLSGTFQSATLAKNMVGYDHIYLVDSLTATHAIRLLADHACDLREKNVAAEEIAKEVDALKSRTKIFAALDTLEYLSKGGRLSKSAAAIGELANLKPMITVTTEGTLSVVAKSLGKNKALITLMKAIKDTTIDTDFPVYPIYAYGTENTEKLEEKLSAEGISLAQRVQIGATIGSHIGPGAFGLIYVQK